MDTPPRADLVIRRSAVLVQLGRSVHDIDAAHPVRLGLRVSEILMDWRASTYKAAERMSALPIGAAGET